MLEKRFRKGSDELTVDLRDIGNEDEGCIQDDIQEEYIKDNDNKNMKNKYIIIFAGIVLLIIFIFNYIKINNKLDNIDNIKEQSENIRQYRHNKAVEYESGAILKRDKALNEYKYWEKEVKNAKWCKNANSNTGTTIDCFIFNK